MPGTHSPTYGWVVVCDARFFRAAMVCRFTCIDRYRLCVQVSLVCRTARTHEDFEARAL